LAEPEPLGDRRRPLTPQYLVEDQEKREIEPPDICMIDIHYEWISVSLLSIQA